MRRTRAPGALWGTAGAGVLVGLDEHDALDESRVDAGRPGLALDRGVVRSRCVSARDEIAVRWHAPVHAPAAADAVVEDQRRAVRLPHEMDVRAEHAGGREQCGHRHPGQTTPQTRHRRRIIRPRDTTGAQAESLSRSFATPSARAGSICAASLPPACARSGLPPPLPPTAGAITCASSCADTRDTRSDVTAPSSVTLPSSSVPRRTPPDFSLLRNVSARLRSSFVGREGTRRARTLTPAIS